MRLTLRSLLAYLDDMLDPTQTKEIGDKIVESEYASALVERIREVMRRRRLSAPDLSDNDPNINTNLISEYLDNTLSADEVTKVERICLESDLHLAEMAACHQILTLILGEPVNIESSTRERMYSLGPAEAGGYQPGDSSVEIVTVTEQSSEDALPLGTSSHEFKLPDLQNEKVEVPDKLLPQPLWRRAALPVVLIVLAAVWFGTVWKDYLKPGGTQAHINSSVEDKKDDQFSADKKEEDQLADASGSKEEKKNSEDKSTVNKEGTAKEGEESKDKDKSKEPVGKVLIGKSKPTEEEKTVPVPPGSKKPLEVASVPPSKIEEKKKEEETEKKDKEVVPPVKADKDEVKPEADKEKMKKEGTPKKSESEVPVVKKEDSEKVTEGTEEKTDPEKKSEPDVKASPVTIVYEENENVLIRFVEAQNDIPAGWFVVGDQDELTQDEVICVPSPFRVGLLVEKLGCKFSVEGNFKGRILGPNEAGATGIEISQGVLIVQKGPETGEGTHSFSLKIGDHLWKVDLLGDTSVCGVIVRPRQPYSVTEALEGDLFNSTLFVTKGNVRIADGKSLLKVLEAGRHLQLSNNEDNSAESTKIVLNGFPTWITEADDLSHLQKRTGALILKEFDRDSSADENFVSLASNDHIRIATHAVQNLELTENYSALVELLSQSKSPKKHDTHIAIINSLRDLMGSDSEKGPLIEEKVRAHFHVDDQEIVIRLLWGYRMSDAADPIISAQLVSYLGNSSITIRELASFHVKKMMGRKFDYQPHASTSQRRSSLRRIQKHIERYGALVPAKGLKKKPSAKKKKAVPKPPEANN